jgi:hypothetical protein
MGFIDIAVLFRRFAMSLSFCQKYMVIFYDICQKKAQK